LMRSAYLKYSMQARIGGMDGIFVAHHNTKEMFGFQYIPLEEMDECTSGSYQVAERKFKLAVAVMEDCFNTVLPHVEAENQFSLTVETAGDRSLMNVFLRQEGLPLQQFTFRLREQAETSQDESIMLSKEENEDAEGVQAAFQATRKRQLQFINLFRPYGLSSESVAIINQHNENPDVPIGEKDAAILPFELNPGIKYIMPFPLIRELRDLSAKGHKEDQENELARKVNSLLRSKRSTPSEEDEPAEVAEDVNDTTKPYRVGSGGMARHARRAALRQRLKEAGRVVREPKRSSQTAKELKIMPMLDLDKQKGKPLVSLQ